MGELPKFNNRIEEEVNSPIREMLRNHRVSELRRIKAVFWWCYMHTEKLLETSGILESMPRNKNLQTLINAFRPHRGESIYPDTYGNTVVYSELQQAIPIPIQQNNLFTHFCPIVLKKLRVVPIAFVFNYRQLNVELLVRFSCVEKFYLS